MKSRNTAASAQSTSNIAKTYNGIPSNKFVPTNKPLISGAGVVADKQLKAGMTPSSNALSRLT
jgi:hypothetical protein